MRIVVVGDLVVDVIATPGGPIAVDSDTPASVAVRGGGSAANTAAWLAEAGADVALVARVGPDPAGRLLAAELRGAGVDARLVEDSGAGTGAIVVLVDPDGRRTMLTDRGASARLAAGDVPASLFAEAGHAHVSGYALLGEGSRAGGLAALRLAAEAGMTSSVTPGTSAPLAAAGATAFLEWTRGTTCCIANREEAVVLTAAPPGATGVELAAALAEHYPEAVVTLGGQGAAWAGGGQAHTLPAREATVVDTTGAGDAFAAGALAAWLGGATRAAALAAGLALAARAVATPGGRPPPGT